MVATIEINQPRDWGFRLQWRLISLCLGFADGAIPVSETSFAMGPRRTWSASFDWITDSGGWSDDRVDFNLDIKTLLSIECFYPRSRWRFPSSCLSWNQRDSRRRLNEFWLTSDRPWETRIGKRKLRRRILGEGADYAVNCRPERPTNRLTLLSNWLGNSKMKHYRYFRMSPTRMTYEDVNDFLLSQDAWWTLLRVLPAWMTGAIGGKNGYYVDAILGREEYISSVSHTLCGVGERASVWERASADLGHTAASALIFWRAVDPARHSCEYARLSKTYISTQVLVAEYPSNLDWAVRYDGWAPGAGTRWGKVPSFVGCSDMGQK